MPLSHEKFVEWKKLNGFNEYDYKKCFYRIVLILLSGYINQKNSGIV